MLMILGILLGTLLAMMMFGVHWWLLGAVLGWIVYMLFRLSRRIARLEALGEAEGQ